MSQQKKEIIHFELWMLLKPFSTFFGIYAKPALLRESHNHRLDASVVILYLVHKTQAAKSNLRSLDKDDSVPNSFYFAVIRCFCEVVWALKMWETVCRIMVLTSMITPILLKHLNVVAEAPSAVIRSKKVS